MSRLTGLLAITLLLLTAAIVPVRASLLVDTTAQQAIAHDDPPCAETMIPPCPMVTCGCVVPATAGPLGETGLFRAAHGALAADGAEGRRPAPDPAPPRTSRS